MIDFNQSNLVKNVENAVDYFQEQINIATKANSWEGVFKPIDSAMERLNKITSVNSHLNAVNFSEELNADYEKTLPIISNFYSNLGTNMELYNAYKNLKKTNLNKNQEYILNNILRDFELSGINLSPDKQQEFNELQQKLSLLSNDFAKNILKATNNYKYKVTEDKLIGLSESDKNKLKQGNDYYLNLQQPNYIAVMSFCDNQKIREILYKAYVARASKIDNFDNRDNINKILSIRAKIAKILGFDNYAQYSLATKMVKNPQEVEEFILDLINKSRPQAKKELQILEEFAGQNLKPWDLMYYSEKYKKQYFGLDKKQLKQYFPFDLVLKGLLNLIKDLYGINYQIKKVFYYKQELQNIIFTDNNDNLVGEILLDSFIRKNKRSGAWMADYQGLDKNQKPIAFVVCNAQSPSKTKPALFDFDDVVTLFHEFGHALHHILTKTKYPSVAGISGVPWDGVELPSQYMEFFAYEPSVIKNISQHYKTKEPLPDDILEKIIITKNFNSALATMRQCEFALWDIRAHSSNQDSYEILSQVRELTSVIPNIDNNYFLNSFGHIFAGGYAAGYYSYKWSEVMAADAYKTIINNREKTKDFRKYILSVGGEVDFLTSYLKFNDGNKPNINSLLELSGIK